MTRRRCQSYRVWWVEEAAVERGVASAEGTEALVILLYHSLRVPHPNPPRRRCRRRRRRRHRLCVMTVIVWGGVFPNVARWRTKRRRRRRRRQLETVWEKAAVAAAVTTVRHF